MLLISYKRSQAVKWCLVAILGVATCSSGYYMVFENYAVGLLAMLFMAWIMFLGDGPAEEVFDCGDELLVRKGHTRVRIPLASIVQVEEDYVDPHNVRLADFIPVNVTMERHTSLGRNFRFLAPRYGLGGGYERVGVVNHLRLRAERARKERTV
jgi:hypothetical protein